MSHAPIGQACSCSERGWMPGVEHVPIRWSMNAYNQRTDLQPVAIVDHIMQGYLATMVDWTQNGASRVIVHFGVGRDGRVVQMHPVCSPGIHAGAFDHRSQYVSPTVRAQTVSPNAYTIGIEHEGCSVDPRPAYTVPPSFIYSRSNPWPEAMVESSIRVTRWCFENIPTLGAPSPASIIGHYETGDPNRVDDPAAASDRDVWPRARIIEALVSTGTANQQTSKGGGKSQGKGKAQPKGKEQEGYADRDYTVIRPGEWLSKAASRTGKSVDELVALNGIADPNRVEAYQVLRLHDGVPQPDPPSQSNTEVSALLDAAIEESMRTVASMTTVKNLVSRARVKNAGE